MRIGLVSDTHGLLRAEVLAALAGSDAIVHGGDIGDAPILDALAAIAPVTAVRGNNDVAPWCDALPTIARTTFGAARVLVVHDLADVDLDAAQKEADVVVCGHSHRPHVERRGSLLIVNPGSAGPRRFTLPVSVARLDVDGARVEATLVTLEVAPARTRSTTLVSAKA